MMATAFDYTSAFGQGGPFSGFAQGIQTGAQLAQMDERRALAAAQSEEARAKAAVQQAALQRQQQIGQAMAGLMANPNPTVRDFTNVAMLLPEKEAASLRANWEALSKDQQSNDLRFGGQVLAALQTGAPGEGITLLRRRAEAERNSGRADQAQAYETWAGLAEIDPKSAQSTIGVMLAALPGGDKVVESVGKVQQQQREAALFGPGLIEAQAKAEKARADAIKAGVDAEFAPRMAAASLTTAQSNAIKAASDASFADKLNQAGLNEKNWNIRGVQNQISVNSARLGLDQQRTAADVQLTLARIGEIASSLPEQAKKDINTSAVAAGAAKQQAAQFNSLATRLQESGGGFGALSRGTEWFKKATGNEDYVTQLRQEFTRLRNSAAVQSLPPGPATDRDIALVLEGFPAATADAGTMASFLRGMAKLQDITASTENARVDWLANNRGSLGRAQAAFPAGDFAAKPGETWVDMSTRIAQEINNRYAAGAGGTPQQPSAAIPGAPVRPGQIAPAAPRVGTPASIGGAMPGVPAPTLSIRQQADAIIQGR
jgi:hypothetical protein